MLLVCRFLRAGVSGGAERAQLVADIEGKEKVCVVCVLAHAGWLPGPSPA